MNGHERENVSYEHVETREEFVQRGRQMFSPHSWMRVLAEAIAREIGTNKKDRNEYSR